MHLEKEQWELLRKAILVYLKSQGYKYIESVVIWNNISSSHLVVLDVDIKNPHMHDELRKMENEGLVERKTKVPLTPALISWKLTPKSLNYIKKHRY